MYGKVKRVPKGRKEVYVRSEECCNKLLNDECAHITTLTIDARMVEVLGKSIATSDLDKTISIENLMITDRLPPYKLQNGDFLRNILFPGNELSPKIRPELFTLSLNGREIGERVYLTMDVLQHLKGIN